MRIGTVEHEGRHRVAVEADDGWTALGAPAGGDLRALIAAGPDGLAASVASRDGTPLEGARPVAPLRPGKIVAIGLNYMDHIREAGVEPPQRPLVFAKFPSSVVGPDENVVVDSSLTERVDWEVELAAVIGRRMRHVGEAAALEHVFGYTVANDVSARDLQFSDGQWVRGKSLDTFCPIGPLIVTADELGDPQRLQLSTAVNGEVVQDSNTEEMVFGVAHLLSFCSRSFTLEPGDVVLTGTPWGCGEFMQPPRSLRPGDVVECEVERIGRLRNPIVGPSREGEPAVG
jgi:2-keto-4-pentenoate hydratase/2-oxohepta-3-ene-1,7-dioic acid hydratase in catechol pathway